MIECKATAAPEITIKHDVWMDLLSKVKETSYLPAYAISTADAFGNFYDMVGIESKYFTDDILLKICPRGLLDFVKVKKTCKVFQVETAVKANRFLNVTFELTGHTVLFVPLQRLGREFNELVKDL